MDGCKDYKGLVGRVIGESSDKEYSRTLNRGITEEKTTNKESTEEAVCKDKQNTETVLHVTSILMSKEFKNAEMKCSTSSEEVEVEEKIPSGNKLTKESVKCKEIFNIDQQNTRESDNVETVLNAADKAKMESSFSDKYQNTINQLNENITEVTDILFLEHVNSTKHTPVYVPADTLLTKVENMPISVIGDNGEQVQAKEFTARSECVSAEFPMAVVCGGFNCVPSVGPVNLGIASEDIVISGTGTEHLLLTEATKEKQLLELYIAEVEQRLRAKENLWQANQDVADLRPDESYFSKLDSSVKKNTAFVKKLKTFTCNQLESLLKDMTSLNLTMYVSEAASAIVEAKLKMADVTAAVELCNALHRVYAKFSSHLFENWHRFLEIKREDHAINLSKLRVDLRFYAELISVGIFTHKKGLPLLRNILSVLMNKDHNNVNIILSFCKLCGEDYAGLVPRKMRLLSEQYSVALPRSTLLTEENQSNMKALFKDYYGSLVKHVIQEHYNLEVFEKRNKKILQTKGELSSYRKEEWDNMKYSYDCLYASLIAFAEILDEDIPKLPEDNHLENSDLIEIRANDGGFTSIWENEEEQRFYEDLTDINLQFLPNVTVRHSEPVVEISEKVLVTIAEEMVEESESKEEPNPPEADDTEALESLNNSSNKILMESFLKNLPHCVNCKMIDSAAVEFVMKLNTKYNRKKLVKALLSVPRTRLDLLPFYARFVAMLHPVVPDVAMELGQFLKQEFLFNIRKKDQINIESKLKIVKFIGELVKFHMFSKIEVLYCLKLLLHDFTHHHIDMCCSLLESCGRFLIRSSDSHQKTKIYLEQMMRKKSVTALESRYVTMIENTFYYVELLNTAPFVEKERPAMHEFIRKILYQDLMKANTEKILRLMRKLDWENPDLARYAVKCLTMAHNVKFYNIQCLASLLAGLVTYQESVGIHVVDGVIEDIRLGMEVNLPKYNQRRVAMIRYLGELYNYYLAESSDIFKVLYSLISFGVTMTSTLPSILDPPDHVFRIRLVCVLLETCGKYISDGFNKLKLDCFFTYFQRYFWFKYQDKYWTPENPFPVGIHYMFKDTLTSLRPKLHLLFGLEEANEAVRQMQMDLTALLSDDVLRVHSERSCELETAFSSVDNNLGTLVERDDDTCSETDAAEVETKAEECLVPDLSKGPTHFECPEDEDFMCAFDRMVHDNNKICFREIVKPQQVDISVPLHIKKLGRKTYELLCKTNVKENSTENFVLLMRKGHKQQCKILAVPISSELALNLKNHKETERVEKEELKRLTLDISERLEEEMLAQVQNPVVVNKNRDKSYKYQHPKDVPHANLIFGSKKIR